MYNLRYHIASLVAVFLSLAIGLLLGTIVVERGTLDNQREAIIGALQDEFRTLSDQNDALSAENADRENFVGDTLPILVSGKLEGRTVMVVTNSGRADGLGSITDAVLLAGGTPVSVTFNQPSLGLTSPDISSAATAVIGPRTPEDLQPSVVAGLTQEWMTPGAERPLTAALVMSGAMAMGELGQDSAADAVVVMAGWEDGPDDVSIALAEAFMLADGVGVGAESTAHNTGVALAAVEKGLSAVDNVDMTEGQYSLVYVLSGEHEGYFGVGSGVQAPYVLVVPVPQEP